MNENTDKEKQLRLSSIADVKSGLVKCDMSYVRELETFVQANNKIYPIKACLTNSSFTLFSGISVVKGCFINEASSETGLNCAVISEALSQKLFGTYDVIGCRFELFNEQYKVTGLYRNKKSLISFLSSDGTDRVYIPYKSHAAFKDITPKTVFLRYQGIETLKFRQINIRNLFKTEDRIYKINDYYEPDILTLLQKLFVFIIGTLAVFLIGRRLIVFCRSGFDHIKSCLKKVYIKEMLKNEKFFILKYLLCLPGSMALIVIIFILIRFKANIPVEYIPYDNIFDLGFYMEKLKSLVYHANLSAGYIPSYSETCYNNALKLKSILLALSVVSFLITVTYIKILNITKCRGKDLVYIFTLPVAAALILSLLFSAAAGTVFCLPIKEIGVIYIYIFIRLFLSSWPKRSLPEQLMRLP